MALFEEVRLGHAESDPPRGLPAAAPWLPGAGLLAVALAVGGASQGNALAVGVVELCGLAVLLALTWRWTRAGAPAHAWGPLTAVALIGLAPILQLMPLPPSLWAALPGRHALAADLALAGQDHVWRPLSLVPDATWRAFLALIAPVAIFLSTFETNAAGQRRIAATVVIFALASVFLAAVQVAAGPNSALRFYAITNADSGVGFFSNRNHLACLLVAAMPLTAALVSDVQRGERRGAGVRLAACLGVYVLLIVGVGVSQSRAGVLLLGPAVLACLAIALAPNDKRAGGRTPALLVVGASVGGLLLVAAFSLSGVAERFHDGVGDLRFQAAPVVAEQAARFAPLGAGLGAFEPVYRAAEPISLMHAPFFNHAHNDYLELWLEAGVAGAIAVLAFIVWWLRESWLAWFGAWRRRSSPMLAPAASAAVGLILVHSSVDYPLRTLAMAGLFAFACGVLASRGRLAEE